MMLTKFTRDIYHYVDTLILVCPSPYVDRKRLNVFSIICLYQSKIKVKIGNKVGLIFSRLKF